MMKNNVVAEKDFDVYKIPLPMRFVRKKKRERFLSGELEKLHPRFSAKDFFDTKLSLEKGKVVANVAVMNKMTFAKYKNNAGGRLLLLSGNGIKSRPIFTAKEKILKKIEAMAAILIFGGVLLSFGIYFSMKKGGENERAINSSENFLDSAILSQGAAYKQQAAQSIAKCQKVFESVLENGGLVTNFSVSKNQAIFKLRNCYPERIFASENCAVSYEGNIPVFDLRLPAGIQSSESTEALFSKTDHFFISSARERISECGGIVKSEMQGNDSAAISFSVGIGGLKKTLGAIQMLEIEKSWGEKSLDVAVTPDGNAAVSLEFLPFFSEESFCNLVASFSDVFMDKTLPKKHPALARPNQKIRSVAEIAATQRNDGNDGRKIGSIRGADGKKIYYIRGNDGKIRKEAANE